MQRGRSAIHGFFQALIIAICLSCTTSQHPTVTNGTDSSIVVSESTPVGTVLRTLLVVDSDGDNVIIKFPDYVTESKTLLLINQTEFGPTYASADLILNENLDRDYNPGQRELHFVVEDDSEQQSKITVVIQLFIMDINDEVPVFRNLPYRLDLREDHASSQVVYTNIKATDPDSGRGGLFIYTLQADTQSTKDAEIFQDTFEIDEVTGDLTLTSSLDYEKIQVFQFTVIATDGLGLNSSEVLTIRILDVQDTAPQFTGTPYVVTINENIPIDTHFFTIRALDGDRGVANDVLFSISSGTCSSFSVSNTTGEVTASGPVDRDDGDVKEHGGMCQLVILVTEIEKNLPQLGPTSSNVTLSIFVTDLNDNTPSFNLDEYFAYIDDTAQLNYPIHFDNNTEMVVEDADQGSSGILELTLRGQDGYVTYDFEPIPSVIGSKGRPLITLKSPGLLKTRKVIILKVYAIERNTEDSNSAVATLNIRVLPVATTTDSTTIVPSTTPFYEDPYLASILGAILPGVLLLWAIVVSVYICSKHNSGNNNKVGHFDLHKAPTNTNNGSALKTEAGFPTHQSDV